MQHYLAHQYTPPTKSLMAEQDFLTDFGRDELGGWTALPREWNFQVHHIGLLGHTGGSESTWRHLVETNNMLDLVVHYSGKFKVPDVLLHRIKVEDSWDNRTAHKLLVSPRPNNGERMRHKRKRGKHSQPWSHALWT